MYVSNNIRDPENGETMQFEMSRDSVSTDLLITKGSESISITVMDFQLIELANMFQLMCTLTIQKAPPTIPPVQE